jgi:Uma2 family endonuclease
VSPTEFLRWEREQKERHEYYRGEVFAMAGGSPRHNVLCAAVGAELRSALRGKACHVYSSDQRVGDSEQDRYVYPDVTVICGVPLLQPGTSDVATNPLALVEVLSTSTEPYDRGLKWEGYQRIPTLTDYLLVSQAEPRIEHFQREADGSWRYRSVTLGGSVSLSNGASITVESVFEGAFEVQAD